MNKFTDFYEAWRFLEDHPIYEPGGSYKGMGSWFPYKCLDVMVVKVDPKTKRIEDDASRNTETNVWLESGPFWYNKPEWEASHDIKLDCGGATFEKAIIKLANLVLKHHGNRKLDG